ncbi:arsenate reductase/protein-tyrosine-phosphatase family protein [Arthrobacter psychrolactophilus]
MIRIQRLDCEKTEKSRWQLILGHSYRVRVNTPGSNHLIRILTVCTANVCRSPLAAALLSELFETGTSLEIISAGTQAIEGLSICPEAALSLAAHGGDFASSTKHLSHRIEGTIIDSSEPSTCLHFGSAINCGPAVTGRQT